MLLQRLAPTLQLAARRMSSVFSNIPLQRNGGSTESNSSLEVSFLFNMQD